MRIVERLIHSTGTTFNQEDWPLLHNLGTRLTSRLFALTGYTYRTLGNGVEVKLAPRFRSTPETYEAEAMDAICRLARPGCTAVDVGANIGLYSLVMGKLVGQTGRVYAFEPADESFGVLVEHVRLNALEDIVEAHQLLITDKSSTQPFFQDGIKGTNRIGGSRFDGPDTVCVERQAIRLDDFFGSRTRRPDVIKIDVEGFELQVLRGAKETLNEHPCTILCEMHAPLLAEQGIGWLEVTAFMRQMGYRMLDPRGNNFTGFTMPLQNHLVICVPDK